MDILIVENGIELVNSLRQSLQSRVSAIGQQNEYNRNQIKPNCDKKRGQSANQGCERDKECRYAADKSSEES